MRATLFHQPTSGGNEHPPEELLSELEAAGIEAEYRSLADEDWCDAFGGTELAIVAGGDGAVARVLAGMPDRRTRLAILPLGSANNVAGSLGYPSARLSETIRGLASPSLARISVCEARGRWGVRRFVEAVGLGALARSTAALQDDKLVGHDKRRAGREALADQVRTLPPAKAAIHCDGDPLPEPALLVECLNTPLIGPNLRLGRDAVPGDEALSVAWLPESRRAAMLDWLRDPDGGPAPLEHRRAACVDIDAHDEPLRIDDKTVEWDGSRIALRTLDTPVTVLVPRPPR